MAIYENKSSVSLTAQESTPLMPSSTGHNGGGLPQLSLADTSTYLWFWIYHILFSNVLVGLVSLVGIAANAVSILVLSKQVSESTNIIFLAMAISDLFVVILALWFAICSIIYEVNPPNFPFEPLSFLIMTAVLPRFAFLGSTCWLTALIAVVRCLCVVLPFKVGLLFTSRRTAFMTTVVFVVIVFFYFTSYFRNQFVLIYFPSLNASKYIEVEFSKGHVIDNLVYYLGFVALPIANIFIVVFCTIVLVIKVKASSNWRRNAQSGRSFSKEIKSGTDSTRETGNKESRLTKTIIVIMATYIVCNMPNNLVVVFRLFVPEFNERGRYGWIYAIVNDICFVLETFNSSVSLFILYKMSSKFKSEVHKMLPFLTK